MSYQALYRKYRPSTFADVVGQQHIVRALTNQIKQDKISHAYLFTGTRGTGKTTCAKILARAVNCLSPKDGSPCNECEVCRALAGNNLDVVEIDAASNNRVDEIRDIREKVKFMPATARYKVYIIDEVHMLTDSAFNALLKTLEEPPAHVIFILATTEVHKLPRTILSRCLKFDFRLVPTDDIAGLLAKVLDGAGKTYDFEAVMLIAENGEGSVRDALSLADMCASLSDGKLTYADVLSALGASDSRLIVDITSGALSGNVGAVIACFDKADASGVSFVRLARDINKMLRTVALIKACPDTVPAVPAEIAGRLTQIAAQADMSRLIALMENLTAADGSMRYSNYPRVILETAVLKSVIISNSQPVTATTAAPKPTPPQRTGKELWGEIVRALRRSDNKMLHAACAPLTEVVLDGATLRLTIGSDNFPIISRQDNVRLINDILSGMGYNITLSPEEAPPPDDGSALAEAQRIKEMAGNIPVKIKG